MKEQNNIDKMFRDQLYDRKVEYDPSAWAEAEKMIADQESKRFFLYRYRYYLSALTIALVSSFIFFSKSETQSNKLVIASANNIESTQAPNISEPQPTTEITSAKSNQNSPARASKNESSQFDSKTIIQPENQQKSFVTHDKSLSNVNNESNFAVQNVSLTNTTNPAPTSRESKISNYLANKRIDQEQNNLITSTDLNFMIPLSLESSLDESKLREESHDPIEVYGKKNKFQGFRIIGGIGMTKKYGSEGTSTRYDPSYFIGIGYERSISARFSVEMNLLFSQRNALDIGLSSTELDYDFGYNLEEIQFDFEKLQYLEIPLMIKYNIASIHQIGIGVQYAYLLQSKVKISYNKESTIDPNQTSSEYKWIQTDLFNTSDISFVIGYDYAISERFKTGLRYQMGLSDMSSDVLSTEDHRNNQLRLVIQFKPWK